MRITVSLVILEIIMLHGVPTCDRPCLNGRVTIKPCVPVATVTNLCNLDTKEYHNEIINKHLIYQCCKLSLSRMESWFSTQNIKVIFYLNSCNEILIKMFSNNVNKCYFKIFLAVLEWCIMEWVFYTLNKEIKYKTMINLYWRNWDPHG